MGKEFIIIRMDPNMLENEKTIIHMGMERKHELMVQKYLI